eukprot:TRINITY_DN1578_c0_g1_i1.p1 TRINITY_DN1578_c0_g1~~TRINITY_DN1578_c0_g1_i1.p1  ORF type:complete len:190 (+),score=70.05 TRINITY_DN1578_c0_g1_i1:37-606(+)
MMSMSDRLVLEVPADYDDMADELDIDDPEGVEEIEQDISGEESESGISDIAVIQNNFPRSPLVIVQDQTDKETQEELEDLEQSLQALEKLDRSSPDLWPDHSIPGVNQFLPPTPHHTEDQDTQHSDTSGYLQNLSREDLETLMQLGSLSVPMLMGEVKRLQNIAYQLGQEESKEMTRGKYLNILRKRNN